MLSHLGADCFSACNEHGWLGLWLWFWVLTILICFGKSSNRSPQIVQLHYTTTLQEVLQLLWTWWKIWWVCEENPKLGNHFFVKIGNFIFSFLLYNVYIVFWNGPVHPFSGYASYAWWLIKHLIISSNISKALIFLSFPEKWTVTRGYFPARNELIRDETFVCSCCCSCSINIINIFFNLF